jgi:hypothetical protein
MSKLINKINFILYRIFFKLDCYFKNKIDKYNTNNLFSIGDCSYYINYIVEIVFNNGKILKPNFLNYRYIDDNIDNIYTITSKAIYSKNTGNIYTYYNKKYFLNEKLHNLEGSSTYEAKTLKDLNNKNYMNKGNFCYYINGIEFKYEEWLNHPDKVRYDRDKKLKEI